MQFDEAVEVIIRLEGGYVNDIFDVGGETKFGISKRSYPNLDIPSITEDDAKRIYIGVLGIRSDDQKVGLHAKDARGSANGRVTWFAP